MKGRLSRARDLLRSRLMRKGLVLSAAFLLTALSKGRVFAETVPVALVTSTVSLARQFGPRRARLALHTTERALVPEATLPAQARAAFQSRCAACRGAEGC